MEIYLADKKRYGNLNGYLKRFHYFFRKYEKDNVGDIGRLYCRFRLKILKNKYGLEIYPGTKIGKGLYLGHAYNITINPEAIIGENCNIHKGVLIGQENRGKRRGAPRIGNKVWIGINAAIVGNVTIGDDVLIAPNSYVNIDVPSHSIVFGNPCIVKSKENATEGYINRCI